MTLHFNIPSQISTPPTTFKSNGNHDYRGDVEAQLNPILQNIDHRWFCQRSFIVHTEIAEFFFVDTTPFVDKYFLKPKDHKYDWRGVLPRNKFNSKQRIWKQH
ncbi:Purple acid phosphatase 3, variant 6 [Lathyrus oleraceus]|uniref:Purple acid phosphatase 3, variant 6 n=1 Tax=Pisum sativum TaxID=3888 RepID=A0A9D4ZWE7_PEA|nr:Purple acid phosphatase 3, variant 6 [Pisum sativum]